MRATTTAMAILVSLVLMTCVAQAAEDTTQSFVNGLYQRFAFRDASPRELTYWTEKVHALTPEAAETHLKNFFFVHAAYKTICDRTVAIDDVEDMVNMLNSGQLTFQAVQWSLFHSDEYKQAKAQGRVGKMMNPALNTPL